MVSLCHTIARSCRAELDADLRGREDRSSSAMIRSQAIAEFGQGSRSDHQGQLAPRSGRTRGRSRSRIAIGGASFPRTRYREFGIRDLQRSPDPRSRSPRSEVPIPPPGGPSRGRVRSSNRVRKKVEKSALRGSGTLPVFPMAPMPKHWSHLGSKKTLI